VDVIHGATKRWRVPDDLNLGHALAGLPGLELRQTEDPGEH